MRIIEVKIFVVQGLRRHTSRRHTLKEKERVKVREYGTCDQQTRTARCCSGWQDAGGACPSD